MPRASTQYGVDPSTGVRLKQDGTPDKRYSTDGRHLGGGGANKPSQSENNWHAPKPDYSGIPIAKSTGLPDGRFATDGRHAAGNSSVSSGARQAQRQDLFRVNEDQRQEREKKQRENQALQQRNEDTRREEERQREAAAAAAANWHHARTQRERHTLANTIGPPRCAGGKVEFLYHQTSQEVAGKILQENRMLRGQGGLAGGGIYFATSQADTNHKAHQRGIVLLCRVHLGRVKTISASGDSSITFTSLQREGFDSVLIPRQNGIEYVVYNCNQVLDIEQHCPPPSVQQKEHERARQAREAAAAVAVVAASASAATARKEKDAENKRRRAADQVEQAKAQQAFEAVARKEHEEEKAKATENQTRHRQIMILRFTNFFKHPLLRILMCLFLGYNYVKDTRNVGQRAHDALTLAQTRLNSQALAGAKAALTAIPQEYTGDKTWIKELKNLNLAIDKAVAVATQNERHLTAGRCTAEQIYVTHCFDVLCFLLSCVLKPQPSNNI